MDTDERFKHLASDPRFKTLKKKQRKVQVDERFQSMFTDERFTLKSSKDKRGRKHKKKSGDDLTKYYTLEKEEKDEGEGEEKKDDEVVNEESDSDDQEEIEDWTEKVDDEDEEVAENEDEELEDDVEDEEDSDQSEVSSSSDESESEDEGVNDVNAIQYDWQPLDHDAEKAETVTRRLAIQNLDWTHLDVRDIYTLVNSIRPPLNVRVYISEFGKARLAKEEVEGPEELADMPQIDEEEEEYNLLKSRMEALESKDSKAKSSFKVNEYEDADEVLDMKNEEIRERIRRYQLSRMKYYYAIAEFDSAESAEAVYKELDGIEYEGSSLELDLRFVPDEMEFDQADMQSECSKVPDLATYKAPQFINSALQQTTVKFTWDETDVKRQEKLQRAYTKEELEKDDLDAYLASDDSEQDEEEDDEDDKESPVDDNDGKTTTDKYRKLLKSLDEEAERKKKVDVDVVWGDYEGDERRSAAAAGKQEKSGGGGAKQSEDKSTSKRKSESKKKKKQKQKNNGSDDDDDDDDEDDAHLDLLVMDARKQEEFKFNPDDDRFGAVYESGLYNIDPSHPNFKRTQAFDEMAEKKREKRRKTSR